MDDDYYTYKIKAALLGFLVIILAILGTGGLSPRSSESVVPQPVVEVPKIKVSTQYEESRMCDPQQVEKIVRAYEMVKNISYICPIDAKMSERDTEMCNQQRAKYERELVAAVEENCD